MVEVVASILEVVNSVDIGKCALYRLRCVHVVNYSQLHIFHIYIKVLKIAFVEII